MKLISSTLFCALAFPIGASAQDSLARYAKVQDSRVRIANAQDSSARAAKVQDSLTRTSRSQDTLTRFAKVQDSLAKVQLKKAYIVDLLLKSPGMRPAMISTTFISRGQMEGNLKGKNILSGDFGQQRTEALLNLPVKNWGKSGMVTATILYAHTNYQLSDIKGLDITESSLSKNTVGLTTTYRRVDSLFGRMFISSASVVLLTGDGGGINKYAVMGNGMVLLKQTAQTTLMVGLQLIIDPTNIAPVIPLLVYQKRLPNGVDLNITIPQQMTLRKTLSKNCWASFGTILSSSVSFFNYSSPNIPRNANFSTLDLKTGPGLEYKLGKLLLAGVSAGLWTPVMYRQYGRWEKSSRYFLDGKVDTTPYINLNLSLIPF